MGLDRNELAEVIKTAIGYEPVRVSMSPGVGGLTHRTAEDRDWLVETITNAVMTHLVSETKHRIFNLLDDLTATQTATILDEYYATGEAARAVSVSENREPGLKVGNTVVMWFGPGHQSRADVVIAEADEENDEYLVELPSWLPERFATVSASDLAMSEAAPTIPEEQQYPNHSTAHDPPLGLCNIEGCTRTRFHTERKHSWEK